MAFDPVGEYGLRRRLRILASEYASVAGLAANLGVDATKLRTYLEFAGNPWTEQEAEALVDALLALGDLTLQDLPTTAGGYRVIHKISAAVWNAGTFAALDIPASATHFKWHYHANYADGALRSTVLFSFDSADPAEIGQDLIDNGDGIPATLIVFEGTIDSPRH